MNRFFRTLSSLAILLGVSLLLAVAALYLYGAYERYRFEQTAAQGLVAAAESAEIVTVETARPFPGEQTPVGVVPAVSDATPVPSPRALEQPTRMAAATRLRIPKIRVDSPVVEASLKDGEWQVPKFVAGHLAGTANPGEVGNVALTGHLESIASGNVFARLKEVAVGDDITLLAGETEFRYTVAEVRVVNRDDLSVVMPTPEPIVTLITCAGTWNPLTRDYSQRLIVVAKPNNQGWTG